VSERIKSLAKQDFISQRNDLDGSKAAPVHESLVVGVCDDLIAEIREAWETAATHRSHSSEMLKELSYLMAAFADEVLIETFKDRMPTGLSGLVERGLFGTMDAGEQVFLNIDRVIGNKSELDVGIAAVYLVALSLGFRGKYFSQGEDSLDQYRRDLSSIALVKIRNQVAARTTVINQNSNSWVLKQFHFRKLWGAVVCLWLVTIVGVTILWNIITSPLHIIVDDLYANGGTLQRSNGVSR
jgi:type IV/VI secretion system ImpK/VasF family protein